METSNKKKMKRLKSKMKLMIEKNKNCSKGKRNEKDAEDISFS